MQHVTILPPCLSCGAVESVLQPQRGFGDRRDMTAHLDAIYALFAVKLNVENAAAPHLGPLFADKARACGARYKAVPKHESGQRSRRTSGRRVFNYPLFKREHP